VTDRAIVIGASAGGLNALKTILTSLKEGFDLPILIVQHISPHSDNYITKHLDKLSHITVKEGDEKEEIVGGTAYFAPPNFHMLVEDDHTISFSVEDKVCYARPSIDVLFETAAYAYGPNLTGIVLTGANNDGTNGLAQIKSLGGTTIVQDPETAEVNTMPMSARDTVKPHHILSLDEIADFLNNISEGGGE
jgi:two-component system chemotaxis response regulator CheB